MQISSSYFKHALASVDQLMFGYGLKIQTQQWQGIDISDMPGSSMHEITDTTLEVFLLEDPFTWRETIKPNLPWADDHFLERVGGEPINPGVQWKFWPWSRSADGHRSEKDGKFNHNYMERYWPKYAGTPDFDPEDGGNYIKEGIRGLYGDLNDVVDLLVRDPLTRQAYLPVWFPEDTGNVSNERRPCSLGYHFMMRNSQLTVTYYIRSCDLYRHFRDDVYLTVKLLQWVLNECRKKDTNWYSVGLGKFNMHISSLHMFENDYRVKFKEQIKEEKGRHE